MIWVLVILGTLIAYLRVMRGRGIERLWTLIERGYQREAFLPFAYLLGPLAILSVPVVYGYVLLHLIGVVG